MYKKVLINTEYYKRDNQIVTFMACKLKTTKQ